MVNAPHRRPREEHSGAETRTHRASRGNGLRPLHRADLSEPEKGPPSGGKLGGTAERSIRPNQEDEGCANIFGGAFYVRDRGIYQKTRGREEVLACLDRAYTRGP